MVTCWACRPAETAGDTNEALVVEHLILLYVFVSFSIGLACLGITIVLATRPGATLARAFLASYASLSILVLSALCLAYADTRPEPIGLRTRAVLEYLESIVGTYGALFTMPYFAHRVFGIADRRRDMILLAVVFVALLAQHLTEFVLSDVWDQRGDLAENLLFLSMLIYLLWIGFRNLQRPGIDHSLARRLALLLLIGLPGTWFDLFISEETAFRVYPLSYCVFSLVITGSLIRRRRTEPAPVPLAHWGLTERETEILHLVRRGLSNKDIGDRLHISQNTVKTHLRSVFDKTGVRSRFELIAQLVPPSDLQTEKTTPDQNHPLG